MLRSDYGPLERLGGADSSVYRGRGNDGGFVTLRFVRTDDPSIRSALTHVAQTASGIRHPMLAAVGGCQRFAGDALSVVAEYVPGQPLDRWIRENGIPPLRMTVDFIRRLSLGLSVAHQRELTHSALHPGNLIVLQPDTRPGGRIVAKLLDVGIPAWSRQWPPRLSVAQYAAPELLRQGARPALTLTGDPRTDVYSCGALLYFMCTGAAPFECVSFPQLLAASSAARPISRPSYANGDIPAELEDTIMRALTIDPRERIESMAELALYLGDVEALWSESGVRRRETDRRRRMTSPDAVTPIVNLRASRNAGGSHSSSGLSRALPRGVAMHTLSHSSSHSVRTLSGFSRPAGVVARAHTAPTGEFPRFEWPPAPKRSTAYAALGVSVMAAALVLYFGIPRSSRSEPPKPLPPALVEAVRPALPPATASAPALDELSPTIDFSPRMDPLASAALAAGSPARAYPTFAPEDDSHTARTERRSSTKRSRERDSEPVETDTSAATDLPVPAPSPPSAAKPEGSSEPSERESPPVDLFSPPSRQTIAPLKSSVAEVASAHQMPLARAVIVSDLPVAAPPEGAATAPAASASAPPESHAVAIHSVRVRGSLSPAIVRRALDRIRPLLERCVQQHAPDHSSARRVELSTKIDEIGRARSPELKGDAPPALQECFVAAAGKLVADSPDTGTVSVSWRVEY